MRVLSKGTLFDDCEIGEEIMEEKKLTGYPSIDMWMAEVAMAKRYC